MAAQKGKKTKEDFTSFLLDDDSQESPADKTSLLPGDKTNNSQLQKISKDLPILGKKSKKSDEDAEVESDEKSVVQKLEDSQEKGEAEVEVEDKTWKSDLQNIELEEKTDVRAQSAVSIVLNESPREVTKSSPRIEFAKKSLSEALDPSLISVEAALKQSEYLKLAQDRIKHLENKLNEVVSENETLASSGLVMQKKYDEMYSRYDQIMQQIKSDKEAFKDELQLKDRVIKEIEKEREQLKNKNEEFSAITKEKIQQVRVRERELMNRLEILQLEEDAVISNKDEIILDLKKQIDRLSYEVENYKAQGREMNKEIQSQKEQMRKTIKALKLSLNILEHEEADQNYKKTGT